MTLPDYIKKYYCGIQARFAAAVGLSPVRVNQRIRQGCIVEKEKIYMPIPGNCIFRDGIAYREVLDFSLDGTVGVERDE